MELTTAQVSERTGISAGTLRVWQSRYGFPARSRDGGGRGRYDETVVELHSTGPFGTMMH